MMYKDEFRRDGFTGVFPTERGYVQISEDYHGEGYHIETWDNLTGDFEKIYLRGDEIFALAKAGVIGNVFGISELSDEVSESCNENEKRERHLQEMAQRRVELWRPKMPSDLEIDYDAAHSWLVDHALPGGDGVPEPYPGDGVPEYYAIEGWGVQKLDNGDFEVRPYYK